MPRSGELPPSYVETPAGLQEMAQRARRLSLSTTDHEASVKLAEFADELESRAAVLTPQEVKTPS